MQQPKKRTTPTTDPRTLETARKGARPAGMQMMGPGLYEQIRRALLELAPASQQA